ncbi:hypothetical protein PRELSG_0025000 [Plasmodium relictum]|uniref:Uncharacterized protein n=1 Tax=Plasmodium relictum TaxID=85471 RepID=A0A1J1GK67_PLARL|nr:hypothetical protein PRELSG_0025000 [Plasmodium relictum]CRG84690.1 hypothetical protein PRELSG_0025000 [Plasmodium relictum]
MEKINHPDLKVIKNYYDQNMKEIKSVRTINNIILRFRYKMNHKLNRKEMYEKTRKILEILQDLSNEHIFLQNLYDLKSTIVNNFMYNKSFSFSFIQSLEVFKRLFELLGSMHKLIECAEKSIKNGFLLRDRDYFCMTREMISGIYQPITKTIKNNLVRLDNTLKILHLSYEDSH